MNTLAPSARLKLARVLNLLTSPVDGEVLAAGRAAHRLLEDAGLHSFEEVIEATSKPELPRRPTFNVRDVLADLEDVSYELTPWERRFVDSLRTLADRGRFLTPKQIAKLRQIAGDHL